MRLKIELYKEGNKGIPFNYQYALAANIYNKISKVNSTLADQLHSDDKYTFYTFSWLDFDEGTIKNEIDFRRGWFFFSSPLCDLVQTLSRGLLTDPYIDIYGTRLKIEGVSCLQCREIVGGVRLRTLSPIYLKTLKRVNGELKPWDLYPSDDYWSEALAKNLVKKFSKYKGTENSFSSDIRVKNICGVENKRIKIAGSYRRCSMLTFEIEGDKELLSFGYQAGFGEKNAMGFGCTEVVDLC